MPKFTLIEGEQVWLNRWKMQQAEISRSLRKQNIITREEAAQNFKEEPLRLANGLPAIEDHNSIEGYNLSQKAYNGLKRVGIRTRDKLEQMLKEGKRPRNVGPVLMSEIISAHQKVCR